MTQIQSSEVNETIEKIINEINSSNAVIFCGAGISRNSGIPTVSQFVPYVIKKLGIQKKDIKLILDDDNYPKMPFELFMEILSENTNVDKLYDIYNNGVPNTNHILLAKLIKEGKVKTVVTTNFDKLIEKALIQEGKVENIDYDVIYKESDFNQINWTKDRARIIKIHGSIDDMDLMAITLKKISSQQFSAPRKAIIDQIFSFGAHKIVIVLGYSSSDTFDLTPQIESICDNSKLVYYIQHSDYSFSEDIQIQKFKNPFRSFQNSIRLHYNTERLVKLLWESTLKESYNSQTSGIKWEIDVDKWFDKSIKTYSEMFKYAILGHILVYISENRTAIKYFEQGLKISLNIKEIENIGLWLTNLAKAYIDISEFKKAIKYTEQSLKISRQTKRIEGEAINLNNLGVIYTELCDINKAIDYFNKAVNIVQHFGDKEREGEWLNNLGIICHEYGKYNEAEKYIKQAFQIASDIGDKNTQAKCLGNLGLLNGEQGKIGIAIDFYEMAIELAEQLGDKKSKGLWLCNLGTTYFKSGNLKEARKYYEMTLSVVKDIEDKKLFGWCFGGLGVIYGNIGEYQKSIDYTEQALRIAREIGDKKNEAGWLSNLGNVSCTHGDYRKAIMYFELAYKIFKPLFGANHPTSLMFENNIRFAKSKLLYNE